MRDGLGELDVASSTSKWIDLLVCLFVCFHMTGKIFNVVDELSCV